MNFRMSIDVASGTIELGYNEQDLMEIRPEGPIQITEDQVEGLAVLLMQMRGMKRQLRSSGKRVGGREAMTRRGPEM